MPLVMGTCLKAQEPEGIYVVGCPPNITVRRGAPGAWNLLIQAVFDPATRGAAARLWTGEAGLLVIGVTVVGTLLLWRTPLLRRP
ncbi:MAG: hypothetical protein HGA45_04290 [Chloroflexales bacterium]|nr:hypothetical protein [Chloroflexales bacterium]